VAILDVCVGAGDVNTAKVNYFGSLPYGEYTLYHVVGVEPAPAQQEPITEIPLLSDGVNKKLRKDDVGNWALILDNAHIRYLDRYEGGFVDSALAAAAQPTSVHHFDHTSAAKTSSDRRITTKLREMGLTCAYNQRVILEVSEVNRTNMFDTKVDLHGTMHGPEGVSAPFRTFQTPLESLLLDYDIAAVKQLPTGRFSVEVLEGLTKGCSRIFATVDNAYAVTEPDTNRAYRTFDRVIVNQVKSQPVVTRDEGRPVEKKPEGNEVSVIEGPAKFPLKVDGWTFTSPQEFMNLTANGCAACGDIPTVFNRNNKHMCVYSGVGNRKATIMDAEFICGNCINNDTKALDKAMSLTLV
jgi:hypothetical protein